jgi:hypothetical protein
VLDIRVPRQDGAFEIQNRLSRLHHSDLAAALQQLCERVVEADQFLQIDKLEIDLGVIRPDRLEMEFLECFRAEFEEALSARLLELAQGQSDRPSTVAGVAAGYVPAGRDAVTGFDDRVMSGRDRDLKLVQYFLRTGNWPWWSARPATDALETVLAGLFSTAPGELVATIQSELDSRATRHRAIYQFPDNILTRLMASATSASEEAAGYWFQVLMQGIRQAPVIFMSPAAARRLTWDAFFFAAATVDRINPVFLESVLDFILGEYSDAELPILTGLQAVISQTGSGLQREFVADFRRLVEARLSRIQANLPASDPEARSSLKSSTVAREDTGEPAGADRVHGHGADAMQDPDLGGDDRIRTEMPTTAVDGKTTADVLIEKPPSTFETGQEPGELQRTAVQNAGLVILWPYFKNFFETLDILDDEGGLKPASTDRAIHLLQYLATGDAETPEYMLPLNKLLCGWSLDKPVDRTAELTAAETDEADQLLQAVIEHWSALKRTSVDGLRASFLQRDGLLSETESHWLLQVELLGHDILLDRLPWGISMIKLSWMKKVLRVDWAWPG